MLWALPNSVMVIKKAGLPSHVASGAGTCAWRAT